MTSGDYTVSDVVALAAAVQHATHEGVRLAVAENLFTALEDVAPGSAVLCASVLRGLGTADAAEVADALVARSPGLELVIDGRAGVRSVDVVLLAIKPPELDACLAVFGVSPTEPPTVLGLSGLCGWFVEVSGSTALITMAGAAGNIQTAMVMTSLWQVVQARTAVIVGMAAGLREKVDLGDVVVAEMVYDYEFARMTKGGPRYQPRAYDVDEHLIRSAEILPRNVARWAEECREIVSLSDSSDGGPSKKSLKRWYPEVHRGVVLAGAKLLEDGSLPKLRRDIHDRVRAAEMEGAGFAAACRELSVRWMVVRGIADFGEPKRSVGWQFASSVAAALFVRESLKAGMLLPHVP